MEIQEIEEAAAKQLWRAVLRARELGRGMAGDFIGLNLAYVKEAREAGLDWNTVLETFYAELDKFSEKLGAPN